jgi:AAA family ATP:ADP antiporter
MKARLTRLFRVQPGETGVVVVLSVILLTNALAMQISYVVSVSGFLSEQGANQMPLIWIVDMLLIILLTGLHSLIVDRFNRVKLIGAMSFGFAFIFVILRLMFVLRLPGWLNYALLYLVAEQQWLFFPLVFWVLANDIFDMAQAKRLFPLIASGNLIGQMVGLGIAAASPALLRSLNIAPEELLTFNVMIYMVTNLLIAWGLQHIKVRQTTHRHESVRETLTEGWDFVKEVPAFRYLMAAILALVLCETIIEFHFLSVSGAAFPEADRYQTFYSLYRLGVILAAAVIQGFLTSRIINRVGLKNAFFILPLVLLTGALWALALPGIASGVGAIVLLKLVKDTVDESSRKSFQALVPEERRGRVSMFMDSYLLATGTIVGAVVVVVIVSVGLQVGSAAYPYVYLGLAVLAALFAIWAINRMRQVYDRSLLNWRLKRRQRGAHVLDKLDF